METDNLAKKWGMGQDSAIDGSDKEKILEILKGWEKTWTNKKHLWMYREWINVCKGISCNSGAWDFGMDERERKIEITCPDDLLDPKIKQDTIHANVLQKYNTPHYEALYYIADGLLFELSNCAQASLYKDIRAKFMNGFYNLYYAGNLWAETEARAMYKYLELVKQVKEEDLAYQTLRNLESTKNCKNIGLMKAHFCNTPHEKVSENDERMLKTKDLYTLQMVRGLDKKEIKEAVTEIGKTVFDIKNDPPATGAWLQVVKEVSGGPGRRASQKGRVTVYHNATLILNKFLNKWKTKFRKPLLTQSDWLLENWMIDKWVSKTIIPKDSCMKAMDDLMGKRH